jgi:hypothetical protein
VAQVLAAMGETDAARTNPTLRFTVMVAPNGLGMKLSLGVARGVICATFPMLLLWQKAD